MSVKFDTYVGHGRPTSVTWHGRGKAPADPALTARIEARDGRLYVTAVSGEKLDEFVARRKFWAAPADAAATEPEPVEPPAAVTTPEPEPEQPPAVEGRTLTRVEKQALAGLLFAAAGDVIEFWDEKISTRPDAGVLAGVGWPVAAEQFTMWLKYMPRQNWDTRLPQP